MNTIPASQTKFSWWPRVIIAGFVLFAAYIGNFVRLAMRSDVDLVSKDYYQKEIAFQEHINTVTQTRENAAEIQITLAEVAGQLVIVFPEFYAGRTVSGTIKFFRPSNAGLDFEIPLDLNAERQQFIPVGNLKRGFWKVQVSSEADGQSYFTENSITLN